MMRQTGKIGFWLFVVVLFSSLSGCGQANSGKNVIIVENGNGGNAGGPAIVTVTDYSGIRVPNVTVVLGDSDGAMQAYGVTDAAGQITFDNAPTDATVTAANRCLRSGSTTTTYSMDIQYDVNGSVVLSLNNCATTADPVLGPPAVDPLIIGTVTVNVTNTPVGVTRNQMTVGRQYFFGYGILLTRQTITLRESDLDQDGTFSVVVMGMDAQFNTIAYGLLTGQTFTDAMTVDVPMEPVSFVQYQISNIPATAVALQPSLSTYNGNRSFWSGPVYSLLSAPSSTTVAVAYVPAFGGEVNYGIDVELDQDHDGIADSRFSLSPALSESAPSDQNFDLSTALSAPLVTVTGASSARPTLSWSGVDPASTSASLGVNLHSPTTSWYFSIRNFMRSRTSLRYPQLPDSLAAFRPNRVDYVDLYTAVSEGGLYKSSSGWYAAP